jgi:hypothetical protein
MTSFVHLDYPTEHPGVLRAEQAAQTLRGVVHRFEGARGAAALLLAAVVSALLVVANQMIDTWTDGHLMSAWAVMWAIAFAALALLAAPLRGFVLNVRSVLADWAAKRRERREDAKLWNLAMTDARVMAELSRAMSSDAAGDLRKYY